MSALTSHATGRVVGYPIKNTLVETASTADWIILDDPGIVVLACDLCTGAHQTNTWNTLTVKNTGTAYDADDVSIVYDGATASTRRSTNFYVSNDKTTEIMYVTLDSGYTSTTGTLTVVRGCLGTTAHADGVANDATLYILNSVVLAGATGPCILTYLGMPEQPKANFF